MKPKHPYDPLLDDLMRDSADPEFRVGVLEQTLRSARRRRRVRLVTRSAVAAFAVILLLSLLLWPRPTTVIPESPAVVQSAPSNSPPVVEGTAIRILSDEELFARLAGRPLALIGQGDNRQLVFLDEVN